MRSIAKDKGPCSFYKLKKTDLLALLLQHSSEGMSMPEPRSKGTGRRPVLPVKIIPSPQEIDEFEKKEMKKSRPLVKSRLGKLHKWLEVHISKPTKTAVDEAFLSLKYSILRLYDGVKKTLKDIVGKKNRRRATARIRRRRFNIA